MTRDLEKFTEELLLSRDEAIESPVLYTRWLYRKDILDLWPMIPDSALHIEFIMSEIAKFEELARDEKK